MTTNQQEPTVTEADPRWSPGPPHVLLVGVFGLFFVVLNYMPLRGSDLWGHIIFGQHILQQRELPTADAMQPLAQGVPVVDTSWLSQVILALTEQRGRVEYLSHLFALTVWTSYLLLARAFYLQSRRLWIALGGTAAVLVVGWSRIATIRPEMFGTLCFAGLIWLTVRDDLRESSASVRPWRAWIGVTLVMALWANLHGSFVCGLALLGCLLAGRIVDVVWQHGQLNAVLVDRGVRQLGWLCLLGGVATWLNPYGLWLWAETLSFSGKTNLSDVLEWQPLVITGVGGREFALSGVVLLVVLRHSRRRVSAADVMLLGLFGLAAALRLRMLSWYAPVWGLVLVPHAADLAGRWQATRETAAAPKTRRRSWLYALAAGGLAWTLFSFSPLSFPLTGRQPRTTAQVLDRDTPLALTQFLREQPPTGLVFNPQWWGDWLVWDGPEGLKPFVTTHIHLVPSQVWNDYLRVAENHAGWQDVLERYQVQTVVLDVETMHTQADALRGTPTWQVAYEDSQAVVFRRSGVQPGDAAPPAVPPGSGLMN